MFAGSFALAIYCCHGQFMQYVAFVVGFWFVSNLVHCKGYPNSDDSWVKEEDIDSEIVEEYRRKLEEEGIFL